MERSDVRKPVVAGQFYPGSAKELKELIGTFVDKDAKKTDAIACIMPHAGYIYSGAVAGATVSQLLIKDTVLLLGPNHTGNGAACSLMAKGSWQTPLGDVAIDESLGKLLLAHTKYLVDDDLAHLEEHSLEVELPFLQYCRSDFKIVPIALMTDSVSTLKAIGLEIAAALKAGGRTHKTLIVASSDMTHYEPQKQAQMKDRLALEAIEDLNEDKLVEAITKFSISMCGYAPVITALCAAKSLGATSGRLIRYQTSADVTGDVSSVVGYAGIVIS